MVYRNSGRHIESVASLTRLYIAKASAEIGYVKPGATHDSMLTWHDTPLDFSDDPEQNRAFTWALNQVNRSLEHLMDAHHLTPEQKCGFIAAHQVGEGVAQGMSFVLGNILCDKPDMSPVVEQTENGIVMQRPYRDFYFSLSRSMSRAKISAELFEKQEFENWLLHVIDFNATL
jgi:hypothetical protein